LLDFYRGYQVREGANEPRVTVPLNDHIDYEGGVVTWIDNIKGERPYGNDLDPTLNLDILEVSFRNLTRWKILETPSRLETVHRIIGFQRQLAESGAFANPRSHIYYLPELYSAYFGRCHAAFVALPAAARQAIDPDNAFELIRLRVLGYVQAELITREMRVSASAQPFDTSHFWMSSPSASQRATVRPRRSVTALERQVQLLPPKCFVSSSRAAAPQVQRSPLVLRQS
jgi:hypothetical protein